MFAENRTGRGAVVNICFVIFLSSVCIAGEFEDYLAFIAIFSSSVTRLADSSQFFSGD